MGEIDLQVTETYDYAGLMGRVSSRLTENTLNDLEFTLAVSYGPLGRPSDITYPVCSGFAACPASPLTTRNTYSAGYLTKVGTPLDDGAFAVIDYHPNGLWASMTHGNGVVTSQTNDPNSMARPRQIAVSAVTSGEPFDTGLYTYDGAGNISAMGSDAFTYDALSRLATANVHGYAQEFSYDPYGNLTEVETTPPGGTPDPVPIPVDSATNRLTGPSYAYDASGNLTLSDGVTYTYDPMHLTTTRNGDGTEWAAIYTADDERLAVWDTAQGTVQETWTLRGLDGLVLREYFFGVGLGGELIFADGFEDHPVEDPLCAWRLWDGTLPTCPGTGPSNAAK